LNEIDPGDREWSVWDKELVNCVVREHQIAPDLIESLDAMGPGGSWFDSFLKGFATAGAMTFDEMQIFRRVATTVRAIAMVGRCIIVGRGGVYATSDLPGGVHVRLIAPLEYRVERYRRTHGVTEQVAVKDVQRIDRYRDDFHLRDWRNHSSVAEIFTLTLNSARLTDAQMVDCIVPLAQSVPAGRLVLQ
jgi:hypothetical protein